MADDLELYPILGDDWYPVLREVLERRPQAEQFIGPNRSKDVLPVRELTFRALLPHAPADWKVVILGQNPYPRIESATGIAMFDGKFNKWDGTLSPTLRNIIKNACTWKYGASVVNKETKVGDLRKVLKQNRIVQPAEWFEYMLVEGCLWLNTALTTGGPMANADHERFWAPVAERIFAAILEAKHMADDPSVKGCVFVLWGTVAQKLRKVIERVNVHNVPVRFVETFNPAAQGDIFQNDNSFQMINACLEELGMQPIDWLPQEGWKDAIPAAPPTIASSSSTAAGSSSSAAKKRKATAAGAKSKKSKSASSSKEEEDEDDDDDHDVGADGETEQGGEEEETKVAYDEARQQKRNRMAAFMQETIDLHKMLVERIMSVGQESTEELAPIEGIMEQPIVPLLQAAKQCGSGTLAQRALAWAQSSPANDGTLTVDEMAAIYMYTMASPFYRVLNEKLRDPSRKGIHVYYPYLRLFLAAMAKLQEGAAAVVVPPAASSSSSSRSLSSEQNKQVLWRGVNKDIWRQYPQGGTVVWWGVSSCTTTESVALNFARGGTMFRIQAASGVSIRRLSAFAGEDEVVLAPGTELRVISVDHNAGTVWITLDEQRNLITQPAAATEA